jgi:hypothetical protein
VNRPDDRDRTGGGAPGAGPRPEAGGRPEAGRDAPHVTHNDVDAPVQDSAPAPDDVAALPANAHGKDVVEAHRAPDEVDAESMYDGRPGEDKDRHETDMP